MTRFAFSRLLAALALAAVLLPIVTTFADAQAWRYGGTGRDQGSTYRDFRGQGNSGG